MKFRLIFCLWLVIPNPSSAQIDLSNHGFGAKTQGLGNVKLYQKDSWSLFNNVGGLHRIENSELGVSFDQRYGIQELSSVAFALAVKKPKRTLGVGIARFGGEAFQQHRLDFGVATTSGILSIGLNATWFQTHIEGFGTGNALLISLGSVTELGPQFFLNTHLSNVTRAKISKQNQVQIPTQLTLGITYLAAKNLEFHSELEKGFEHPPQVKIGLNYQLETWIFLRTGFHTNPNSLHFGLGLHKKNYGLDYAIGQTTALGETHHLSVFLRH